MKNILRLEEIAMAAIAIYLISIYNLQLSLWIWVLLFFAPDLSMIGYLVNNKIGAIAYNIFHHKGVAIACAAMGYFMQIDLLLSFGILLFAHASFDRVAGYGLKYFSSFNDTHLGKLKNDNNPGAPVAL